MLSAIGAITILLSALFLTSNSVYPGFLAWFPCAATALVLATSSDAISSNARILKFFRPLIYVGDVSYSFYLWHFVWIMLPLQYAMTINVSSTEMSPVMRLLQIFGAFTCAALSNHFIEKPIRTSSRINAQQWSVLLLLVGCIGTTLGVTYLYGAFGGGLN